MLADDHFSRYPIDLERYLASLNLKTLQNYMKEIFFHVWRMLGTLNFSLMQKKFLIRSKSENASLVSESLKMKAKKVIFCQL